MLVCERWPAENELHRPWLLVIHCNICTAFHLPIRSCRAEAIDPQGRLGTAQLLGTSSNLVVLHTLGRAKLRLAFNLQYLFFCSKSLWAPIGLLRLQQMNPHSSHTETSAEESFKTLLRLLLPLNEQVWFTSRYVSGEPQTQQSVKLTNPFNR
jgi:hypothetical protein